VSRVVAELWSDSLGTAGTVIRYGHWGRPVLVFPSEQGKAWDFENNGMVEALSGLLDAGRLKLYCVDSYDAGSWSNQAIPLEERARQHGRYEAWIVGGVVRPSGLAARPGRPAAGVRPGPVGGHHRVAGEHQAVRRAAERPGHPARTRSVGP
jgi:esterase/lipase superfamily enzyme